MTTTVERFLTGTNNRVEITLTTDGAPLTNLQLATQVDIDLGGFATISRTSSANGVDYSQGNGLIVINPGKLTEDLSNIPRQFMASSITVFDIANTEGVRFGGADSDPRLMFSIR